MIPEKTETTSVGMQIMSLDESLAYIDNKLSDRLPYVLLQSRQFGTGPRANKLFESLCKVETDKLIINVDNSARTDFEKHFQPCLEQRNHGELSIRHGQEKFSNLPGVKNFVGRNHLRLLMLGEEMMVSTFDLSESCFDRDEMVIRVSDPEVVQNLKTISMWDFENTHKSWKIKTQKTEIIFDCGKDGCSYVSEYINENLPKHIYKGSEIWIASSWHPDELEEVLKKAYYQGGNIKMLINRPNEYESKRKLPFNLTKWLSAYHFHKDMSKVPCQIFFPKSGQIHAKFLVVDNSKVEGKSSWWVMGTDNFTRYGSMARTVELGLADQDGEITEQLTGYVAKILRKNNLSPDLSDVHRTALTNG